MALTNISDLELGILAHIAEMRLEAMPVAVRRLVERFGEPAVHTAFLNAVGTDASVQDTEERPQFLSMSEFLRKVGEPIPSLVPDFLPDKRLLALTGKPKSGKSYFVQYIGECLAFRRPLFDALVPSRYGCVFYLCMEDGDDELAARMLKRGISVRTENVPLYVCTQRVLLSHERAASELKSLIDAAGSTEEPVLVIVDTAREALGIKDWFSASEISDKLRPLRQFARENCTVLLVAHNRKAGAEDAGDEISGSNAFTSSVDGWISATRSEDLANGNRRLYLSLRGRGGMRGERVVEMDTHTLSFRLVGGAEIALETQERQREKREVKFAPLFEAIESLPNRQATVPDIAKAMGQEERTTRKQVEQAVEDGFLAEVQDSKEQTGRGRGRPAARYQIVTSVDAPPSTGDLWNYGTPPTGNPTQIPEISPADEGTTGDWEEIDL